MSEQPQKVEMELPLGMSKEDLQRLLSKASKDAKRAGEGSSEPVVFAEIDTGFNKQLRVHHTVYKGRSLLSIQNFWKPDENADWQFGKAVTFDYEVIQELIDGLTKMKEWCEENPNA